MSLYVDIVIMRCSELPVTSTLAAYALEVLYILFFRELKQPYAIMSSNAPLISRAALE